MKDDVMVPGAGTAKNTAHPSTASLLADFAIPAAERNTPPVVDKEDSQDEKAENPAQSATIDANKYISPDLSAEILIGTVDTIQTMVFSAINKRKMKRRFGEDMDRLEVLVDRMDEGSIAKEDIKDDDRSKLKKIRRLIEVFDNIPFTEEEKTELKKPLTGIIEQSNLQVPPGVALVIAVANVMAPRVADAFSE